MSKCKGMRSRYLNDVLKLHKEGYTYYKISKLFGINKGTIMNWVKRYSKETSCSLDSGNKIEALRLHEEYGLPVETIQRVLHVTSDQSSQRITNFVPSNKNQDTSAMKESSKNEKDNTTFLNSEVKDLKAEIARLESHLRYQEMRADAYDTMINIAEKKFNIPIRKKSGAKR